MKSSVRRITNVLLAVGVCFIAFGTVSGVLKCDSGTTCFAASTIFGLPEYAPVYEVKTDFNTSVTTLAETEGVALIPIPFERILSLIGIYMVTSAVIVLIALEILELYYLRKIFARKVLRLR